MNLDGAVGVVTGAGSGLGEGTARMIVENGGKVAILDLPTSAGADVAAELGDAAVFAATDVSDTAQVSGALEAAVTAFGHIDLLVNCAGISPAHRVVRRDGSLYPLDVFRRTIDVNLVGTFDMVRQTAGIMGGNEPGPDGERGLIVNVASIAGYEGQIGQAAYSASKGGIIALTLPLARDLAALGIRVMSICPGIMDTGMLAGADEARRQAVTALHVFPKRLGTPADFARLVRCFAEDTLLNGEVVRLDAATRLGPR